MRISRRNILGAAGAVGLASAASRVMASPTRPGRVIDIHTHNYTRRWVEYLRRNPDEHTRLVEGQPYDMLEYKGTRFSSLYPAMLDFGMRVEAMDAAGVDLAILSLTSPNVFWGDRSVSSENCRLANDDYAEAQKDHPNHIRWMASLPWQYPDAALIELERAIDKGAVGIATLTNILGAHLEEPQFYPVWEAIEKTGLPVFVHPTMPAIDMAEWGVGVYALGNTIGFTSDTSLAFARLIHSGFMDRFPGLRIIASHGGGALPFLITRMDKMWEARPQERDIANPPSTYLRRFWYDAIVYDETTLRFLVEMVGADRVLYGSDYPFSISDMVGVKRRVSALPSHMRDMILHGNAEQLYRL